MNDNYLDYGKRIFLICNIENETFFVMHYGKICDMMEKKLTKNGLCFLYVNHIILDSTFLTGFLGFTHSPVLL